MDSERPRYYDVRKVPRLRGLRLQRALARLTEQASAEETAAILAECPGILERLSQLEKGEAQLISIEEVAAKLGIRKEGDRRDVYSVASKRLGS